MVWSLSVLGSTGYSFCKIYTILHGVAWRCDRLLMQTISIVVRGTWLKGVIDGRSRGANRSTSILRLNALTITSLGKKSASAFCNTLSAFTYLEMDHVYGCRLGSLNAGRKFNSSFERKSQGQVLNHLIQFGVQNRSDRDLDANFQTKQIWLHPVIRHISPSHCI